MDNIIHLNTSSDRLQAIAPTLAQYNVQLLGANHCKGMTVIAFLWHQFAGRCVSCQVGTRLELGI